MEELKKHQEIIRNQFLEFDKRLKGVDQKLCDMKEGNMEKYNSLLKQIMWESNETRNVQEMFRKKNTKTLVMVGVGSSLGSALLTTFGLFTIMKKYGILRKPR